MVETQVKLSNLAIEDLIEVESYTAKIWGEKQADKYLTQLEQQFYWLAEHKGAGKSRSNIAKGLLSFPQNQHVIFYRIKDSILEVARILHQSMDIEYQFSLQAHHQNRMD